MTMYRAIGAHVFAGGFTMGVREVFGVDAQLETHGIGQKTVEKMKVPFYILPTARQWDDLYEGGCSMCYGNPRCTGFSCMTGGYDEDTHGPWARQTADVHDLCEFGIRQKIPVVVWESVQQAYSVGRPLLDYLEEERFRPAGYRVAHVLMNAATFGNAQRRPRYFFVAYDESLRFNALPPKTPRTQKIVSDVLPAVDRHAYPVKLAAKKARYAADCYQQLTDEEWRVVPHLLQGECLNHMARDRTEVLRKLSSKLAWEWDFRLSKMPFSMHCIRRLHANREAPTIHSSASRWIHPRYDRPLTVRELARIMGWKITPAGWNPIGQIAKGLVPAVGEWIAEQVRMTLDDEWDEDFAWHRKIGRCRHEGRGTKLLDFRDLTPPKARRDE